MSNRRVTAKRNGTAKKYDQPRILVVGGGQAASKVRRSGGDAVVTSYRDERIEQAAKSPNIHGLLLNGGGDVDPTLYGAQKDGTVYGIDSMRDLVEMTALDGIRERGLPILGICRGAQIMNVHAGGTLHLDIGRDARAKGWHHGDHLVEPVRGSRLAKAWRGAAKSVVSIHHQAVADVAPGMLVSGLSSDRIVEAIESVEGWELGVQFHPEMDWTGHANRIFDLFVKACADKAGIALMPDTWERTTTRHDERETVGQEAKRDAGLEVVRHYRSRAPRAAVSPSRLQSRRKVVPSRSRTKSGPVTTTWYCFPCQVPFDVKEDYVDHMTILHHAELELR